MDANFWLYMIPSALFGIAIYRQFGLVVNSPAGDRYIATKVAFLVFNLSVVAGMWLMLYSHFREAIFFFIIPGAVAAWVYNRNKNNSHEQIP